VKIINPGILTKITPRKVNTLLSTAIGSIVKKILLKFVSIAGLYLDFFKDVGLLATLIKLVGLENLSEEGSFTQFPMQVILLMTVSICLPILILNISLMFKSPRMIFGFLGKEKMSVPREVGLKVLIFLLGPLTPALLLNNYDIEKEKRDKMMRSGVNWELMKKQNEIVSALTRKIVSFKYVELMTEVFIQLIIIWIMICLTNTETKTVAGFEASFQKSEEATSTLLLSGIFSFTTVMFSYVRINLMKKHDFLLVKAQITLALNALVIVGTKVACIVIYFTPFMGLFSLLGHLAEENKAPFEIPEYVDWTEDVFPFANTELKLSEIYRYSVKGGILGEKLKYEVYTIISLKTAYYIFFLIFFCHLLVNIVSKLALRRWFRQDEPTSLMDILKSSVTSLLISDPVGDWDQATVPRVELRKQNMLEILVGVFVNWVFNMILLLPLYITGVNIVHRHSNLKEIELDLKPAEVKSYITVIGLMISMPLVVVISSIGEYTLMWVYHHFFHPWVSCLVQENKSEKKRKLKSIELEMQIMRKDLESSQRTIAELQKKVENIEGPRLSEELTESDCEHEQCNAHNNPA